MISKAYVFIDGLEETTVVCGLFELNSRAETGQFVYGKSYLARKDAFPLDPVHLPLSDKTYTTNVNKGVFGALADAGADSWGRKLILSLHTTKPKNEIEYLLAGSGFGVGCLVFSLSRSSSKPKKSKNILGDLNQLIKTKDAILNNQAIPPEAKKAFEFGVSMGGARPKTLIEDKGKLFIAKFNRPDDLFNVVRAEHAAMLMAKDLGIQTASTHVYPTPHGDVLLVERFDIAKSQHNKEVSHHYLSGHSIFNARKISEANLATFYSYGKLAEFIRQYSEIPEQAQELFKRMVFNCFIGNTDDHSRNHAFLYDFKSQSWQLSPAFDIVPISNSQLQGIGVGEQGRIASIENLLSQAARFALKPAKAKKIIAEVKELVSDWPVYFKQDVGMSDADIERLRGIIPELA